MKFNRNFEYRRGAENATIAARPYRQCIEYIWKKKKRKSKKKLILLNTNRERIGRRPTTRIGLYLTTVRRAAARFDNASATRCSYQSCQRLSAANFRFFFFCYAFGATAVVNSNSPVWRRSVSTFCTGRSLVFSCFIRNIIMRTRRGRPTFRERNNNY